MDTQASPAAAISGAYPIQLTVTQERQLKSPVGYPVLRDARVLSTEADSEARCEHRDGWLGSASLQDVFANWIPAHEPDVRSAIGCIGLAQHAKPEVLVQGDVACHARLEAERQPVLLG